MNQLISTPDLPFVEKYPKFPGTRYQGSKLKLTKWIWDSVKNLDFETVLDAFGGTGCVSYIFKKNTKTVTYNDILKFNWWIGKALIENNYVIIDDKDIDILLNKHSQVHYPSFIFDNFNSIYFTEEENRWLDIVVNNINLLENIYKKAIAYFALFQSCIIKRPYNLFHRKNLYMRTSNVKRNFGNKTTWDTPFDEHFLKFIGQANQAVFDNNKNNIVLNQDVFNIEGSFDLVYIDTPYISKNGMGLDYLSFYHFLEGIVNYNNWADNIDHNTKNKNLRKTYSIWTDKNRIYEAFDKLFQKFENSILVISYRSDGIPSINDLIELIKKYKREVLEFDRKKYKYVLSKNFTQEVLLIGK